MIFHHVYFTLKESANTPANRDEFEKGLEALFGIETVAGGAWGRPANTEERPVTIRDWDYALAMTFHSLADHDAYQVDSRHDDFIARHSELWEKVRVMDLEKAS